MQFRHQRCSCWVCGSHLSVGRGIYFEASSSSTLLQFNGWRVYRHRNSGGIIHLLSLAWRWTLCFKIILLKKADANTIYSILIDCLKTKNLQLSKIVGMGFSRTPPFPGVKNGVQSLLKKNCPHSLFVYCHCHRLQLACGQAANHTSGIKHVYVTFDYLVEMFSLFFKTYTGFEGDTACPWPSGQ